VESLKAVEARRTASRLKAARATPTTANLETGRLASQTLALPLLRQVPRLVMPCLLFNVLSLTSRLPLLQFNLPPSHQLRSFRPSRPTPPSSNRACKLGLALLNLTTRPDIARLPQLVLLITTIPGKLCSQLGCHDGGCRRCPGPYEEGEIQGDARFPPTTEPQRRSLSQSFTAPRFAALAQQDQSEVLGPTGRPQLAPGHFMFGAGARRRGSSNGPMGPPINEEDIGFQFPQQQGRPLDVRVFLDRTMLEAKLRVSWLNR
jgi:hypothetical protein